MCARTCTFVCCGGVGGLHVPRTPNGLLELTAHLDTRHSWDRVRPDTPLSRYLQSSFELLSFEHATAAGFLAEIASVAVVSSVERTSSSGPSMSLADERCHHANGAWMSLTLSLRPPAMGAMRNTLRATGGRSHWMSSSKVGTRLEVSGMSRRHTVRIVRKVFAASTPRPRRRASGSRMPVLCIHAISLSKSTSAFSRTLIGLTDSLCTFGTFQSDRQHSN